MYHCIQGPYSDIIRWSDDGNSIIITDKHKFATAILPHFYKTDSLISFIRQLNNYGFKQDAIGADQLRLFNPIFTRITYKNAIYKKEELQNAKAASKSSADSSINKLVMLSQKMDHLTADISKSSSSAKLKLEQVQSQLEIGFKK